MNRKLMISLTAIILCTIYHVAVAFGIDGDAYMVGWLSMVSAMAIKHEVYNEIRNNRA